ncbi:hypothetical protein ABIB50_005351 [Mucilaginibacter sp. UYCu711]
MPRKSGLFLYYLGGVWAREHWAPFPGYLANFVVYIDYLYVWGPKRQRGPLKGQSGLIPSMGGRTPASLKFKRVKCCLILGIALTNPGRTKKIQFKSGLPFRWGSEREDELETEGEKK